MDNNTKAALLGDDRVSVDGVMVRAPKLSTIRKLTFSRYLKLTNLLTISQMDLELFYDEQKLPGPVPTPFDYIHETCIKEPLFFLEVQIAFLTYLEKEVVVTDTSFVVTYQEEDTGNSVRHELNNSNFYKFQELLKTMNFTQPAPEPEFNASESDSEFVKIFEEARKKLKLAKERERRREAARKGSTTSFPDIVSSLCTFGVGYTLFNVWDLNIYQFYDQLYRNRAKETYDMNIDMLMNGVEKSKLDLEYWMADITIK